MINKGFTSRANKIIRFLAQEEAKKFNADKLLPEHIVLAIFREQEGVAVKTLQLLGADIYDLILDIEEYLEKRNGPMYLGDVIPSQEVQRMIDLSIDESKNMGYNYVGTEHLLLAAMQEPGSFIAQILEERAITATKFREGVIKIIGFGKVFTKKDTAKKTPLLDDFGRDLTLLAKKGKLDKVIGRDVEIERVIQILSRRTKNNPVLIGEPGVGKTAIVEGLAQKIVENNVPETLINKRVVVLDLGQIVAGTKYRGEFEDRIKKIMKETTEASNIVLFLDELHTIIGAGGSEGSLDASNMLKPALSRGELQCIGATTLNEYKKYIEKDAALERRFQPIVVDEPNVNDTISILRGIKNLYEEHHNVVYTDKALELSAKLSHRYIADRYLPDKAIDIIDEAGSRVRLKNSTKPVELYIIDKEIEDLNAKKNRLIKEQLFEECEDIKNQIDRLTLDKENIINEWQKSNMRDKFIVDEEDILEVLSIITKIPLSKMVEKDTQKLLNIENELRKRVVGQDEPIKVIASAIRRSRMGLSSKRRPTGSFIFLGPTGVGKTELARSLANFLFGDDDSLIRIDMSDYMEKHNVSRLVGAPPGYVGYEEGGVLTEKIRRKPYSVILLDEIEKAHPDVFNILLQILEEGEIADNLGHNISFRNTIIIMTSNVGARQINKESSLGFFQNNDGSEYKEIKSSAMNELKKFFNPEFLNRIDETVVFRSLAKEDLMQIVDIMFVETKNNLKEKNIEIELTEAAKNFIIEKRYDKKYGARTLRRAIQTDISDAISLEILNSRIKEDDIIEIDVTDNNLTFIKRNEDFQDQVKPKKKVKVAVD
ncbi:MAG TPA: ATP-dependent Clp protease ATP-binding subunit [Spirochaetota bacterium]|nr:ATP-dependent Clp protease ATP-binding subunit [Spirochaetota bacterium]HOS32122.1 ATP-dependent Clp protease ATP-binding subunit [Spirochaetota bacterium]HOS54602.1 ATP-dependent Clp protease ATP-binding subunit [Spirochaetota bacterium]HPK62438.1 ATP-dependent Clp protease ATP-binding subunit [Spirochaetota bacterium]HQF77100.1 ATP-dependent Clp protease ATP-binding subunit [Spirochaetota bacterium]